MNKEIKVSVVVPTFNHEDNISQTLNSILNQNTEFEYEVLVGEDDSQDRTRAICRSYAEEYPNQINLFLNDRENVIYVDGDPTGRWNLMNLIKKAEGKYIALCEGDDYWIDEEKLQKQIEYMESESEIALSFHPVKWEKNGVLQDSPKQLPDVERAYFTDKDLLQYDNFISTCSVMFRNGLINEFPDWFREVPYGDVALHMLNAQYGKIGYIDEVMAIYVDDGEGMYSGGDDIENCLKSIETYNIIADNLNYKNTVEYYSGIAKLYYWLRNLSQKKGDQFQAKIDQKYQEINNDKPIVSVIIPTYNRPQKLKKSIQSVLNQNFKDLELIVVNDGGEDIGDIIQTFDDSRLRYLNHDKNKGLAAARNTGLKNARGKYLAFLDDDDEFYSNHLEVAVRNLKESEQVVYTDAKRFEFVNNREGEKELIKEYVPYSIDYDRDKLLCGNIAPVNCFVFDSNLIDKAGYFDEQLPVLEDWDFWIRLSKFTDFRHIEKVTTRVNWYRKESMTDEQVKKFETAREEIYRKNARDLAEIDNIDEILEQFDQIWNEDEGLRRRKIIESEYDLTSIIMLTYNALDYTKQSVNSIFKNTKVPYELIIVDNNSSDGTRKYLKKLAQQDDRIKIILNEENKGFAGGNNQGMEIASGNYIQLINNDVLVPEGWLKRMIDCAEADNSIGMVGPITNESSGLQKLKEVPYSNLEEYHEFADYVARQNQNKYTPRSRISAFAFLMKRKVYEEVGKFDETFGKGNYEDDDFCLRATKKGFKIMLAEDVFIHHYGNATFDANEIDYQKLMKKNEEKFHEKWPDVDPKDLSEADKERLEKMEKMVEEGNKLLDHKNYQQAQENFKSVLEENPVNLKALIGMAMVKRSKDEHEEALQLLDKILSIDPNHKESKNLYGIYMFEKEDVEKAQQIFEEVVNEFPEMKDARSNLGEVYIAQEKYQKGVDQLIKVLEIDPQDVPAMLRMSQLNLEVGRYEQAEQYVQKALEYEPDNEEAREVEKIVEEKIQA